MSDQSIDKLLAALRDAEACCRDDGDALAALERKYEDAGRLLCGNADFLAQRNVFRIANAPAMRIRRPKILLGRYYVGQPNFQSLPLMQNADVVFLSLYGYTTDRRDAVSVDVHQHDLGTVLSLLPQGFAPDFYFDYQVCASETFLRGLEDAPFPTVASVCHMLRALKIERIAEMFDFLLPVSRRFGELLDGVVPREKIVDLPFGLSWGSFDFIFSTLGEDVPRDIDVLLSFGPDRLMGYGPHRARTIALFEQAMARLGGRYKFVRAVGLSKVDYMTMLKRSRIVLNAVSLNGPYNYRTCEVLNAGALLMQYDARYATGSQYFEEYFVPGEEFVPFDETDFFVKLEALLADPARSRAIAKRGNARLCTQYSYQALHRRLLDHVRKADLNVLSGRRLKQRAAAKNRLYALLQCDGAPHLTVSNADMTELLSISDRESYALLLPLYPGLGTEFRRELRRAAGIDVADRAQADLAFYDTVFAAIGIPSAVDRFNHLLLCAGCGRLDLADVQRLIGLLQSPELVLDRRDIARIWRKGAPAGEDATDAVNAEKVVLNLGCLLAGDDVAARSAAARDYMLIRLYGLLAANVPDGQMWRRAVARIFASHPITEYDEEIRREALPLAS
jgi:hypothetical protein